MKKLVLLSLTLLAAVFVLSNTAKAQQEAQVDLEIVGENGYCIVGTDIDLGTGLWSATTFDFDGDFNNTGSTNERICYDKKGTISSWSLPVTSTSLEAQNYTLTDIPAVNVKMSVDSVTVTDEDIDFTYDTGDLVGAYYSIDAPSAAVVFGKTSLQGTVGTLTASNVLLKVVIPAGQGIDQYQGTITIGVPTLQ